MSLVAPRSRKTHCKRGHELTQENCAPEGWPRVRRCRLCDRLRNAKRNARFKGRFRRPGDDTDDGNVESPPPRTSSDLLAELRASVLELEAASLMADVHRANMEAGGRYTNEPVIRSECEKIMIERGIPEYRQYRVMSASIALAKEQGVVFRLRRQKRSA